jgi:hypothetical protein
MTDKPKKLPPAKPLPPPRYTPRPSLTMSIGTKIYEWLRGRG